MSVDVETAALSMSEPLDSLKTTPLVMHRVVFELRDVVTWYAIMREARALYGRNWRAQPRVRRKLTRTWALNGAERVWFEVPDPQFGTWCSLKLAVVQEQPANK